MPRTQTTEIHAGRREAGTGTGRRQGCVTVTEAEAGGTHFEDSGKAMSQCRQVAARSWKRQEYGLSPEPEQEQALLTP